MKTSPQMSIQVDQEFDTGYIRLSSSNVAETVEVSDLVLVDLDEFKVAVGVEVLSLSAEIPFSRLRYDFHVDSRIVELLRQIQPTLGKFFTSVTTGSDSTVVEGQEQQHGRRRALETA